MRVWRQTSGNRPRDQRDEGAALILAVGFFLMVGAICGGLASLATSSVTNRKSLELVRDREYAADAVIENAIVVLRGASMTCSSTMASPVTETVKGVAIRVDWINACSTIPSSDSSLYTQRNVIFTACANTGSACLPANIIIRAQVNFEPYTGTVTKTFVQSWNVNR